MAHLKKHESPSPESFLFYFVLSHLYSAQKYHVRIRKWRHLWVQKVTNWKSWLNWQIPKCMVDGVNWGGTISSCLSSHVGCLSSHLSQSTPFRGFRRPMSKIFFVNQFQWEVSLDEVWWCHWLFISGDFKPLRHSVNTIKNRVRVWIPQKSFIFMGKYG